MAVHEAEARACVTRDGWDRLGANRPRCSVAAAACSDEEHARTVRECPWGHLWPVMSSTPERYQDLGMIARGIIDRAM